MGHMEKINWAVLGCGNIAKTFMSSVKKVANAKVVACASSELSRAQDFAKTHNIDKPFGSYSSMLQDDSVDAVYIATTHNFHFSLIMQCLKQGKHVLCEKPMTLNAQQAKVAFDYAQKHKLLLVEAVWTRFLPAILSLKETIQSGVIGNVQCVQSNFSLNRILPDSHRLNNKKLAGGALLDLGIYPITIADIVFGEMPKNIHSHFIETHTGVDKNSFFTLEYADGAIAQLACGFRMSGPTYANIMGDKGQIHVPHFLGAEEYTVTVEGEPGKTFSFNYGPGENFVAEIAHMTECLLQGSVQSELMPPQSTLRVLEIMDTIRQQWGFEYDNESCEH